MTKFSEIFSRKALVAALSLSALLSGVGCTQPPTSNGSCQTAAQCTGTDVCVAGACISVANKDAGNNNNGSDGSVPTDLYCGACTSDSECGGAGNFCVTLPGSPSFCGNACINDTECATGAKCYSITEGGSKVGQNCLPTSGSCAGVGNNDAGNNNNMDAGNQSQGVGYCGVCTDDSQCPTGGYCLATSASGPANCGEPCGSGNSCPSGSSCAQITDQNNNVIGTNCFPTNGDCTSVGDMDAGNQNPQDAGNQNTQDAGHQNQGDAGPGGSLPTIDLTGCGIVGYLAPVKIGTQTFSLSLDTGSSTTAVAASSCSGCTGVTPAYTSDSSTQTTNTTSSETYGDGTGWNGTVVSDTMSITPSPATARVKFAEITKSNGFFRNYDCAGQSSSTSQNQGIIGFGPSDLTTPNTQDFFTQLIASNSLSNAFATQLCPQGGGHMWLGGYDSNYASAAPEYTTLDSSSYLTVTVSSAKIGSTSVTIGQSILDTGTTINLLPNATVSAIQSALQSSSAFSTVFGSSGYSDIFGNQGNCDPALNNLSITQVNAMLPSMTFTFASTGGGTFNLDVPATGAYLSVISSGGQTVYCDGMDSASSAGLGGQGTPGALLGDVFLSSYITIFDEANNRAGFAPRIDLQLTAGTKARYGAWAVVAGASEGLGAAFAGALAARGHNLILIARRAALLETLSTDLRSKHGVEIRVFAADLAEATVSEQLSVLAGELEIGVGVYNAAYAGMGPLLAHPVEESLRVVDVNCRGPLRLIHALAPAMAARKRGALVLMSSQAGFQGVPTIATYAASKAFNIVLGEGLWAELKSSGIDVLVSCAGAIRTPNYQQRMKFEAPGTLSPEEVAERSLEALGSGPLVSPGMVNKVARFVIGRLLPRRMAIKIFGDATKAAWG